MNKKIKFVCILSSILIITTCTYPVIISEEQINNNKKVTIETCFYNGLFSNKNKKELTIKEANEIKQILLDLDEALENKNHKSISYFHNLLTKKGIINNNHVKYLSLNDENDSNITYDIGNNACFFKAKGTGVVAFPLEKRILEWITDEAGDQGGLGGIILAILLIILFYIPVMLVTHIIPLRVASPNLLVQLNNGTMNSFGLQGNKRIDVNDTMPPAQVNLSFFTGITIGLPDFNKNSTTNIISSDEPQEDESDGGFLFVFGYANKVEEINNTG